MFSRLLISITWTEITIIRLSSFKRATAWIYGRDVYSPHLRNHSYFGGTYSLNHHPILQVCRTSLQSTCELWRADVSSKIKIISYFHNQG